MFKLQFSPRAKQELASVLEYLEAHWGEKTRLKFEKKLAQRLDMMAQMPHSFPKSPINKLVSNTVLIKQVSIFFSVSETHVNILSFFDNRQNPAKLKDI